MAKIAFCQDALTEYMGFMQMAAVLEGAGHTVELFFDDQMRPERFVAEVERFGPDIVGFSVLTPSRGWAIRTAGAIRAATGAVTVCGNVDVILNPEAYVDDGNFDLICTGEGEFALGELADAIDAGADWTGIHGFWWVEGSTVHRNPKQEQLVDMDEMPPINRRIYDKYSFFRRSPYLKVYAGRGCPYRCSFCSNTTMTDAYGGPKKYYRKRDPETFVDDIVSLIDSRPNKIKKIIIIDEVLWLDRRWLRAFLTAYRDRVGIPFTMNFKFNGGIQEEDIKLMGEAGATGVAIATETGDEELRKDLLNKPVTNEHILQVTSWLHKYGVRFGSSAFFGLPGQTAEQHLEELDFFREVKPQYLWTTFFQPYPGVNLTNDPRVASLLPEGADFETTLHQAMYLGLPDRTRLVNLKKSYHFMYKHPWSQRPLAFLSRWKVPVVFDLAFFLPFISYYMWAEGVSARQFAIQFRDFALKPMLRRGQTLNTQGRPFDIGYESSPEVEVEPPRVVETAVTVVVGTKPAGGAARTASSSSRNGSF